MNIPSALKYTKEHEWLRVEGNVAFAGITDFAQGELGDIVFLEIETCGESLAVEEVFGGESSFSSLRYSPFFPIPDPIFPHS